MSIDDDFEATTPDFFGFFTKRSIQYKVILWFDCDDIKNSMDDYIEAINEYIHCCDDYEGVVTEGTFTGERGTVLFAHM